MIEARNIYKKFGKIQVLSNFSVDCKMGECIALIGPNGSGKSTFIKTILGMVIPDSGELFFNNHSIKKQWMYRSGIGYMPQIGQFPENMKIADVLDMMIDIRGAGSNIDEELIEAFDIKKIDFKRMGTLSGGTKQKIGACLAFLFNPLVLILDEPTAGLDPLSAEILREKIKKEHAKGKLIVICSHILSELDDLISELIYIQEGKMLFHKSVANLKQESCEEKLTKAISTILKKQL